MRFENHFDVQAPIDTVWNALDVERVAPTVPGAQILARTAENAYNVAIKVKVGPMSMTYRGDVQIMERDDHGPPHSHEGARKGGSRPGHRRRRRHDGPRRRRRADVGDRDHRRAARRQGGDHGRGCPAGRQRAARERVRPEPGRHARGRRGAASVPSWGRSEAADAPPKIVGARTTPAAPQASDALDLGSLGGAVIVEQLNDPRTLGGLVALVALLAFLAGRRSARG